MGSLNANLSNPKVKTPWFYGDLAPRSVTLTIHALALIRRKHASLALCHGSRPAQDLRHVHLTPTGKPDHVQRQRWGQDFLHTSQLQRRPCCLPGRTSLLALGNIETSLTGKHLGVICTDFWRILHLSLSHKKKK